MTGPAIALPEFVVPQSAAQAHIIQDSLRSRLKLYDDFNAVELIAGVDVGYDIECNLAHASIVTMKANELKPIEQVQSFVPVDFPYIPGLLAFREIPAILAALAQLKTMPDIVMVDGQGIAHPRRMGIAAHLGVILDWPSLGVGKSRLTGKFDMPLFKGDTAPLMAGNEQIGTVLRSKDNVNPLFISPGHRVSMKTSLGLVLRCLTRYRLPEPTRLADKLSKCPKPANATTRQQELLV